MHLRASGKSLHLKGSSPSREDAANKVTLETVSEELWQFSPDKMICGVGILEWGDGVVSSPLLVWEAGREIKVREGKIMLGTYSRIFIIRKAHHSLYYTIASFYCQDINSFLSFLAWLSLRLCLQPCNPIKAELSQPLCSRTEHPKFMVFILPSLQTHFFFRQGGQPGGSTTHMKQWELSRGTTANCQNRFLFNIVKARYSALWTNIHPGFPRKNTFSYYYFSALLSSFLQL